MSEKLLGNLQTGVIFILSAPAGTGKTTLVHMLLDEFPCITKSISCTTRSKRYSEIADKDYHFLTKQDFEEKQAQNQFLEKAEVFGNHYGTLQSHVEEKQTEGKHVILVIDTQGALELMKKNFDAVYIFIQPPSLAELRSLIFKRKTEETEHIEERLSWAQKEISVADQYDYQITNDNLHRAYEILRSIFIAEEHKKERYDNRTPN